MPEPKPGLKTPTPPKPPTVSGRLVARTVWTMASVVSATTRWHFDERSGLFPAGSQQRVIFALWHNRQLLAGEVYRRFFAQFPHGRRLASIASASSDGAIAARVLELFGAFAVRGSSSRRGARALTELIDLAARGFDLAVTPDGPRGPRYEVKPGVVALAQHSGLPLVPVTFNFSRKRVLGSWDGFQVPLPFGRCEVRTTEPLWVPPDLEEAEREPWARQLQDRLRSITQD